MTKQGNVERGVPQALGAVFSIPPPEITVQVSGSRRLTKVTSVGPSMWDVAFTIRCPTYQTQSVIAAGAAALQDYSALSAELNKKIANSSLTLITFTPPSSA
jgi:hypothetical protein